VSQEFEPIRIGSGGRGVAPVVVGVLVVALGLGLAIVKPWESDGSADGSRPTSPAGLADQPSAAPIGSDPSPAVAASPARITPEVTARPRSPTWSEVTRVIRPHDVWGVRAIVAERPADDRESGFTRPFFESWAPTVTDPDGTERGFVDREGLLVVGLGLSFPPDQRPQDARIWRVHTGDRLEWIDTQAIEAGSPDGAFLFVETSSPTWRSGDYRIDVLVDDAVRRIMLQIPDRNGQIPELEPWPPTQTGLIGALDSDPSGVRVGLFATVDGVGVPIGVVPGRPLDEEGAWLEALRGSVGGVTPSIATVYLPGATGLGVMLTNHGFVHLAELRRLAPSELAPAPPARGGISDTQGRTPFVVFGAPSGEAMAPGVYAISVSWTDDSGLHAGTWHVELRPGPVRPSP
jgi:hypothetical protein